ncbi:MAG: hypothetical protein KDK36_15845, partial [Leptospiraceae bacterium]|nr:hypothetical protein [Leptospiraceae bacterium]
MFKIRIATILYFASICFLVYYSVLGSTGFFERKHLEAKLKILKEDVERLEIENKNLLAKANMEQETSYTGEFLLTPENAGIIKFKEFVEIDLEDKVFTSHVPLSIFKNKKLKNKTLSLQFLKFFYLTAIVALGVVYII